MAKVNKPENTYIPPTEWEITFPIEQRYANLDTKVDLCGTVIDNPIIPASGTFGYGYEFADLYNINILGTFSFKGTTREPRYGNEQPRIAESPSGMLNSVGLQNPGVDAVIENELPKLAEVYNKKVIANVGGFSVDEYVYTSAKLSRCDQVGWIELNISCPNVHGGGMSFGTDPKAAAEVVSAVKKAITKPLIVKLTPNVQDITVMAKACEDAGADALSLINTILAMRIDIRKRKPVFKNVYGGLSGAAIFPIALRMVYDSAKTVKIPIIGMGGIDDGKSVIEMMLAGATAVQIGAENLLNPFSSKRILIELKEEMAKLGITKLSDIIGGAL